MRVFFAKKGTMARNDLSQITKILAKYVLQAQYQVMILEDRKYLVNDRNLLLVHLTDIGQIRRCILEHPAHVIGSSVRDASKSWGWRSSRLLIGDGNLHKHSKGD